MALIEAAMPSLGATSTDVATTATNEMKAEMRMAKKPPSEWLYLLCPEWASSNAEIAAATDALLMSYKPYLGGQLSSQLLCRLSIFGRETFDFPWMEGNSPPSSDFWKIVGVEDDFDRAHIVGNIERFCSFYNICGGNPNDSSISAAFSPIAGASQGSDGAKDSNAMKIQQRRSKCALKEREKEAFALRKAAEKAARVASREEKRQQKIEIKRHRAEMAKMQREVAFKKVAEVVQSARFPTEIIGGFESTAAAPKIAPALAVPAAAMRKNRSSIVISTASDLDQIVSYSNLLWEKYNAAAKEHNKRVKWIMVAKELGINVKVREKYARMHVRAKMRGFDFVNWGHYRIKDYPQYFLEPLTPPLASLAADENHSPPEQETYTLGDSMSEVGGNFADSAHETDQAIFNLAMEVAEAGGYSSDPAPEYMADMEATIGASDELGFPPFSFGGV
mmetsp:Transcript_14189/g.28958  ORF Transcript_14189/g.28958 Transcript_14189/m.28958 type:complete len:449 (+) Transcript_14189:59-1405(+)|eukprot:CAMPEP_0113399698 /NCGR_PEP_ID=MMETSP0013_2-20120614/15693_1 /TAXON_ID=2843 ORGANISM="Skeletonema costatum, Strain 1716" /NCGR_SAMPLE_ID=MMETSP0013_2 /ASSEMBLY_ACC=CAM_ASM_000158 /LENGTH=448 /DNA_ID=CAMNT_0000284647 /DNA_START=36 /DNA_END=1382 /DNA_ORIENTATION=+ /assembly_acc=CAM_ASM_000158